MRQPQRLETAKRAVRKRRARFGFFVSGNPASSSWDRSWRGKLKPFRMALVARERFIDRDYRGGYNTPLAEMKHRSRFGVFLGDDMSQATLISETDLLALRTAFLSALTQAVPALADDAEQALARISPAQWLPEWGLPLWLGETFGLPPEAARTLALCNVFGLAYVKLQDDLYDDEIAPSAQKRTLILANLAYQQALARYARLLGGYPSFWATLDTAMARWSQAMLANKETPARAFIAYQAEDFQRLAQRGAPLHIGMVGTCLLAGRADAIPLLRGALDDFLIASVLMDHAHDWVDDLAAGRYNTFLAHACFCAPALDQPEVLRRNLLQTTFWGDGGQSYFALARTRLDRARATVASLGCAPLDDYLAWCANEVASIAAEWREQALARLHAFTDLLFGDFAMSSPHSPAVV